MARQSVKLRQTASPDGAGRWDLNAIFNREVYPAIRSLEATLFTSNVFPPLELTGTTNAIVSNHEHKNLLVSSTMPTELTISVADSNQFPEGAILIVTQTGAGQVEFVPAAGVTIHTAQTLKMAGQDAVAFLLKRDGTEWQLFGDIEDIPVNVALLIQDRFIGGAQSVTGTNTNANVGQLQWNTVRDSQDGTVSRVASTAGHPGVVRLTGHATLGSRQAMYLGHTAVSGSVVALNEVDYFEFLVRNVGTGRFRLGIGDDSAAAGLGNDSIYVNCQPDVEGFWRLTSSSGGALTTALSSIPIVAGVWVSWRIQIVSASEVRFFADGTLVATYTTNIPSFATLMAPAVQVITITPGPFQGIGEIDLFTMQMKVA